MGASQCVHAGCGVCRAGFDSGDLARDSVWLAAVARVAEQGQGKGTMSLFTNGNARVTRLIIWQLAMGAVVMVLTQVLANLPAQDWLTLKQLKIASFVIGLVLTTIKGGEMFFSKTVSLFRNGGASTDTQPPFPPEKGT